MDRLSAIFEQAKSYCRNSTDRTHLQESIECAKWLCEREGGDPLVVMPAIALHDIGWSTFSIDEEIAAQGDSIEARTAHHRHEEEGAALARTILAAHGFPPARIDEIAEIILWHESKDGARSKNDAIVKDANMLSRFTPKGFLAMCAQRQMSEGDLRKTLQTRSTSALIPSQPVSKRGFTYRRGGSKAQKWRRGALSIAFSKSSLSLETACS